MILLLLYTATVVPYRTAFIDKTSTGMFYFELFINALFIGDLILSFFSAYEKEDGKIEWRQRVVIADYVFSWFILDLLACFPF
jgi:hypothetical protein